MLFPACGLLAAWGLKTSSNNWFMTGVFLSLALAALALWSWENFTYSLKVGPQGFEYRRPWGSSIHREWNDFKSFRYRKISGSISFYGGKGKAAHIICNWSELTRLIQILQDVYASGAQTDTDFQARISRASVAGWGLLFLALALLLAVLLASLDWPMSLIPAAFLIPFIALLALRFSDATLKLSLDGDQLVRNRPFSTEFIPWSQALHARSGYLPVGLGEFSQEPALRLSNGKFLALVGLRSDPHHNSNMINKWLEKNRRLSETPFHRHLDDCVENLAEARKKKAVLLKSAPETPGWMSDPSNHPLGSYFSKARLLLEHGAPGWGLLIRPNALLFDEMGADAPGVLLTGGSETNALERLIQAAEKFERSGGEPALNAAFGTVSPDVQIEAQRQQLPLKKTVFSRLHWPRPWLGAPWFPVLSLPAEEWAMVLPHFLWPAALQHDWILRRESGAK